PCWGVRWGRHPHVDVRGDPAGQARGGPVHEGFAPRHSVREHFRDVVTGLVHWLRAQWSTLRRTEWPVFADGSRNRTDPIPESGDSVVDSVDQTVNNLQPGILQPRPRIREH